MPLGALGLNAFSHPCNFQVSYVFPSQALVPLVLSKFLAEYVNGPLRHLLLVAPCWMEAPWLPTVLNMLADVPQQCPIVKHPHHGCFGRPGAQRSAISAFNPWLLSNMCYGNRGSLPQSVRWWSGQLKHLHQGSTSSAGRNGPVGVLNRVHQTMQSLPLN